MESDILSSDNWNFDKVPDNELVACCYWEYARESVFIRDTLREYRGWILADGKWEERTGKLIAKLEKVQSIGHMSDVFLRGCAFSPAMVRQSDDPKKPDYSHPDAPPISGNFPAPWQSLDEANIEHASEPMSNNSKSSRLNYRTGHGPKKLRMSASAPQTNNTSSGKPGNENICTGTRREISSRIQERPLRRILRRSARAPAGAWQKLYWLA